MIKVKVSHDVPLAEYTSLKAGGPAQTLVELEAGDDLQAVIADRQKQGPLWVLGFGTNCLISNQGLPGNVIVNKIGAIEKLSPTLLKVDSGLNWDDFVQAVIKDNLWGIEFMSGIPGGVGAAVAGSITAYGHKVADTLIEAEIFDPSDSTVEVWPNAKLDLLYRTSALHRPGNLHLIVLNATFELSQEATGELEYESALRVAREMGIGPDSLDQRRQIIMETRRQAGSLLQDIAAGPWTAGSFFKNPAIQPDQLPKLLKFEERPVVRDRLLHQTSLQGQGEVRAPAAHVLLAAGFKRGQTWGNVRLHPDHILKIENLGSATAQEIYAVVQNIITTVRQKLGITLEPEVRFLGEF